MVDSIVTDAHLVTRVILTLVLVSTKPYHRKFALTSTNALFHIAILCRTATTQW